MSETPQVHSAKAPALKIVLLKAREFTRLYTYVVSACLERALPLLGRCRELPQTGPCGRGLGREKSVEI